MEKTDTIKTSYIFYDLLKHVHSNKPFSLIRPGESDFTVMYHWINTKKNKDDNRMFKVMLAKNGIDKSFHKSYIKLCKMFNEANYLSGYGYYFEDWNLLNYHKKWQKLYRKIYRKLGITNTNFCFPYINLALFCEEYNLIDHIKDKGLCLVCSKDNYINFNNETGFVEVPKKNFTKNKIQNNDHYLLFDDIMKEIEVQSKHYDIFLICAGMLGKFYTIQAKRQGKVGIDIGNSLPILKKEIMRNNKKKILKISDNSYTFKYIGSEKDKRFLL